MRDLMQVLEFHKKFELPCDEVPKAMSPDRLAFRLPFLYEEAAEYEEAFNSGNLVQAADALFDLVYVAVGTGFFIGMPPRSYALWPENSDVNWTMREVSMICPQKPQLLPIGLHMHFSAALRSRIDLFKLAHDAALNGELNAIDLALVNLRALANACHIIAALMGVPWHECFGYVHQANMKKKRAERDGSDSKRGTPWDVVKPTGWTAPDALIARTLIERGWNPDGIDINYATGKVALLDKEST